METILTQKELFIKMVIAEWEKQNNNFNRILSSLNDEQISKEIAPGKNTGVYLTGHLIAISDAMLPLLGFGEKLFPHLDNIFIKSPDKSGFKMPSLSELKDQSKEVQEKLTEHIGSVSTAEWFSRHMAVSEKDFENEPHRNKLNVIINRTNHMSYHLGQLILLQNNSHQ